jgi:acetyl esterase/lipase
MGLMLAVVVLGAVWGLVDGLSSSDDAPTPRFISAPPPAFYVAPTTVEYKTGLQLDVYRPKGRGPFPAVLLIHGGGFTVGGRSNLYDAGVRLANEGVLAASVDYTLNGTMDPARTDVRDAYRWLAQQRDVDPSRTAVMGTSAGCMLSAWLALTSREPRAAVLVACPGFFPDLVTADAPETLLVHNTGDGSVPVAYSRTLDEMLTKHHVPHDVVIHQGGTHFTTLGDNWPDVAAWLVPRLRG